ncbi:hypothetical protein D9Q98_004886 [Chlorella vulgaris]|uniref:Thioredoxin n=1 Tax=Chlorella vulgaris TaxID=3077 RepID=A0A9D4TN17_CHLVU|nr:hypothetical protein D9Q98_004886 [Chlorella vulgaris]
MSVESFQELVAAPLPTLVFFSAPWCGSCRIVTKAISVLEPVMADRVSFEKVDVVKHAAVGKHYRVLKLPTLALFKDGELVDRYVGAMTAQDLQMYLQVRV